MPKDKMRFESLSQILSEPEEEHRWLVDDILPTAGLSLLAGKPKAGKSTLARTLALAVARGKPWLEKFMTSQGAVIYLALEEKRQELKRHFGAMGASGDDPITVFVSLAPSNGLSQLRAEVEKTKPALVIIDPLLRLIRIEDANDYALVSKAFEPLLGLARDTGSHVLALHHIGKGDHSGGDAILGSTAIYAAVDTALLLTRSENHRTLSSKQRYGNDLDPLVLEMDEITHTILAAGTSEEATQTRLGKRMPDYLASTRKLLTEDQLCEVIEGKTILKQRTLKGLFKEGRVIRAGEGKRGSPYLYSLSASLAPTLRPEPEIDSSLISLPLPDFGLVNPPKNREDRDNDLEEDQDEDNNLHVDDYSELDKLVEDDSTFPSRDEDEDDDSFILA
jgi:predicted ATP-dependent serine protease